jgi:3-deoxy-manno-octulosonate cytidylyltransferase (CMP-KDO synthetase)
MKAVICIPARYGSTRFEGKPLVALNGIPMIRHVFERSRKAAQELGLDVYVLTDDERIASRFGPDQVWVSEDPYPNGTERVAGFAASKKGEGYTHYINVQGDMPDVTTDIIKYVYYNLNEYMVTTAHTEMDPQRRADPSMVKQVNNNLGEALWFGRGLTRYGVQHLGIYGYERQTLLRYPELPVTAEEDIEQLEQLRWLKYGIRIGTQSVYYDGVEINTPEDVERWHERHTK